MLSLGGEWLASLIDIGLDELGSNGRAEWALMGPACSVLLDSCVFPPAKHGTGPSRGVSISCQPGQLRPSLRKVGDATVIFLGFTVCLRKELH